MKLFAVLCLLALALGASAESACYRSMKASCPLSNGRTQLECESCLGEAAIALCDSEQVAAYCEMAVVQSFHNMPTEQDPATGLFVTEVPKCGAQTTNCWTQTKGEAEVAFLKQTVTSSQFPCKSGQSSTSFTVDAKVAIDGGADDCSMEVKGFGGKTVSLGLCKVNSKDGLYFGFDCPVGAGKQVQAVGPTNKCDGGFGSYTATITCPLFELVTYIKF